MTSIQSTTKENCPTLTAFLTEMKPANLLLIYADIDRIDESVSEVRLTVGDLKAIYADQSKAAGVEYVEMWLRDFELISNINNPLKDRRTIALMIYKECRSFYFSDMKLIFEQLLRGEYGPFYGSVDATRLCSAFFQYRQFRNTVIHQVRERRKEELKKREDALYSEIQCQVFARMRAEHGENYAQVFDARERARIIEREIKTKREELRKEFAEKYDVGL